MPIYSYECLSCSDTLERRQSFSDDPLTVHEACGGSLRRVIHPAGIVFKGSGFYNTDYKNSTPSNKPAGDAAADTKPADAPAGEAAGTSASASDAAGSSNSAASTAPAAASSAAPSSAPAPSTP